MIKETIYRQKNELQNTLTEKYIKRNANIPNLHNNIIKVINGPRRSGKSFFAMHTLKGLGNFGYANFDDEVLTKVKNYNDIIASINLVYNNPKYLLLDEIQNLDQWEYFVNRLQREGFNLFITGSNSKLLSGELASHLTGRYVPIQILPFSFAETLNYRNISRDNPSNKKLFPEYLINGGYPELYSKNADSKTYCKLLFENVLFRDIIGRYKIRNFNGLNSLSKYLISNTASKYSYLNLSELTDIKSDKTVKKFVSYFEEVWLFKSFDNFSFKAKDVIKSPKKIYSIDNGFISANSLSVTPDFGKLLENFVAIELLRLSVKSKVDIFYWSNQQKYEVDFVLIFNKKILAIIQVCYNLSNPKTLNREYRALVHCSNNLKCNNFYLINLTDNRIEDVKINCDKKQVNIIPAYNFSELLNY